MDRDPGGPKIYRTDPDSQQCFVQGSLIHKPLPQPQASVAPPIGSRGANSLAGEGVWGPNFEKGTLYNPSMYG
jgi:hypothetical protein